MSIPSRLREKRRNEGRQVQGRQHARTRAKTTIMAPIHTRQGKRVGTQAEPAHRKRRRKRCPPISGSRAREVM